MARNVLHTIEDNMHGFSKGQKLIARYILDNYDTAAFMTASKLGKTVKVSESTVVRFASELGYDGYPGMQKALQELVRSKLTSIQRIKVSNEKFEGQDIVTKVLQADVDKIQQAMENMDHAEFDLAVEKIMSARHVYILGVRSSSYIAGYLNFYLHLLCENVTLVQCNSAGEIFEQLFRIGPGDVLIGISFPRYSTVAINTIRFAYDRGADVIGITDSKNSPVYQMATASILAQSEMISFVDSMVAPLSVINALILAIGNRMEKDVSHTFEELEGIWNRYGVFGKTDDE